MFSYRRKCHLWHYRQTRWNIGGLALVPADSRDGVADSTFVAAFAIADADTVFCFTAGSYAKVSEGEFCRGIAGFGVRWNIGGLALVAANTCNGITDCTDIAELFFTDANTVFGGTSRSLTQFGELLEFVLGHGRGTYLAAG